MSIGFYIKLIKDGAVRSLIIYSAIIAAHCGANVQIMNFMIEFYPYIADYVLFLQSFPPNDNI